MVGEALAGENPFPERRHIAALTMRFQTEYERLVEEWARWADVQVAAWDSTTDAGSWDVDGALESILARAGSV